MQTSSTGVTFGTRLDAALVTPARIGMEAGSSQAQSNPGCKRTSLQSCPPKHVVAALTAGTMSC